MKTMYDVTRTTTASKIYTVKVINNETDEFSTIDIVGADLKEAKKEIEKGYTFWKVLKEESTKDEKRGMTAGDFKALAHDITGCSQTERLKYYITRRFFTGYGIVDMYNKWTRTIETYTVYGKESDIPKLAKETYDDLLFCQMVDYTKGDEVLYGMSREEWEKYSAIIK